jgi:hypothetical protein
MDNKVESMKVLMSVSIYMPGDMKRDSFGLLALW